MKVKKKTVLKISIVISVLMVMYALLNKSYGVLLGAVGVVGLGMVLIYAVQVLAVVIGLLGQGIISGLTGLAGGGETAVSGLKSIFFNHNSLTTAAYFANGDNRLGLPAEAIWDGKNVMFSISSKITEYYTVMRNLAIAILLFVLLYIAIRMVISTVASEEAKYKKMLKDWVISLALVFVLHYIMVITFFVSNTLVSILEGTIVGDTTLDYKNLIIEALAPITGIGEAIIFLMLIGMEMTFLFMYVKRVIVLGFLILIAPLITITYSIDKVGDGKSQALNNWLKEFIYNVIIQPFHCILYITLIDTVIRNMSTIEGVGSFIIYIIVLQFVKEAEEIIKRIFNIQAQSMPGMKNMGAIALGAMTAFGGLAKAGSAAKSKKKMPKMTSEAGSTGTAATGISASRQSIGGNNAATAATAAAASTTTTAATSVGDDGSGITPPAPPPDISGLTGGSGSGATPSNPPSGGSGDGSGATPPTSESGEGEPQTGKFEKFKDASKKFIGKPSDFAAGFKGAKTLFEGGPDGNTRGNRFKRAAKVASVAAFAGMGLGMGDSKSALGLGMTAYGTTNAIEGAISDSRNMQQLEQNEQAYNAQYEEYVEQMRALHPRRSEEAIRRDLIGMFEAYDNDTLNLDDMQMTDDERKLKRGFLEGAYTQLRDSYEVTGGEKPTDLVKSHTSKKSSKYYNSRHENS